MQKKTLAPRKIIDSTGKLHYNESFQAWNTIKIKKELFSEFPELKEKRSAFSYQLIYHRDPKELQKLIQKMIKEGREIMPILMFLYKDG
jgi:hypothetical protein